MTIKTNKVVVFDLDDTLYKEIDYLKSAFKEIAKKITIETGEHSTIIYNRIIELYSNKLNAFELILDEYSLTLTKEELLSIYRNHFPNITISSDKLNILKTLKNKNIIMGIISDGRSIQQRNKIKALGINKYFSEIIISEEFGTEKPSLNNFIHFEKKFGNAQYFYVGDNIKKDFIAPNKLNWITMCLKNNGLNIHKAPKKNIIEKNFKAKYLIDNFSDILKIIN